MFLTGLNSTQITSRVVGGEFDSLDQNTLFFFQNKVMKCNGYLIAKGLGISSGQCFFEVDISGYKASNHFAFAPDIETREPQTGESKSYTIQLLALINDVQVEKVIFLDHKFTRYK